MSRHHYNLALSPELYEELKQAASDDHMSLLELMRKLLGIGLVVREHVLKSPGAELMIRRNGDEMQVVIPRH